ncbi:hypothetical protein [Larkinella humicola]|uniref:Uncharacterized protein n=1 Tax=Larkinella humicola TaxID=2607654 RepID=A0A5N1JHW8_9BACT|nr:hypothetical protein [Larkinella humicola]KAA9354742.1 hypothetical protein F0P93_09050 [Larkinella humicola]
MSKKWIFLVFFFGTVSQPAVFSSSLLLTENRMTDSYESRKSGDEKKTKAFSDNPLLLDGISLDYSFFSLSSRGKLTVVAGDPYSPDATKIPFRAYLRRDGKPLNMGKADGRCEKSEIELSDVLAYAQVGDDLVIEPTRKEDAVARRIIRLKLFWFLKLPFRKGDGC